MIVYTLETDEFMPVAVATTPPGSDPVPVLTGVEFSITTLTARPTVWVPSVNIGGVLHVRVYSLALGGHKVWARVTTSQETAVFVCGEFLVE